MPQFTFTFKRVEKKYLLTPEQYRLLRPTVMPYVKPDEFGKSTILSLYLDTPDYRMIRSSIEAYNFKEKLRIRSYGVATPNSKVFLEAKRKYNGVVYKRRIGMKCSEADNYIENGTVPADTRIMKELDYTMEHYGRPAPAALIICERQAFFFDDNPNLRITFDENIRARVDERLTLTDGTDGTLLLPEGYVLMEFKTDGTMPLWLARALNELEIYPTSFSKYGTAYRNFLADKCINNDKHKGVLNYA